MKSNVLLLGPACLLALMALAVTGLSFQYVQLTRQLNQAQSTLAQIELHQNRVKALINECVEHSQKHTNILPLLQSIGLRPNTPLPISPNRATQPQSPGR